MKSKVILIISAMFVLGLGIAVYALNSSSTDTTTIAAACCCCSGDSCPMKSADAKAASETAHECCCKGGAESCPMMNGGAAHKMDANMKHDMKMANGESCPMMKGDAAHKMDAGMKHDMKMANGESCPMMKDGAAGEMHKAMTPTDAKMHEMHKGMASKADGTGCSCACCSHGKEKKDTPAI